MRTKWDSPCKVNLLLNVLGKRSDGYHELETVMLPVSVFDSIEIQRSESPGIQMTCSHISLPTDSSNLAFRAAECFFQAVGKSDGIRMHLEKRIPIAAGLGGGSSNAATTLLGLNEIFGHPLPNAALASIAAQIGSDVPFFLKPTPTLATGRGERIKSFAPFSALMNLQILLIHPGFGVSTPWAYNQLARYPDVQKGVPGRGKELVRFLEQEDLEGACAAFYNSLEAPVLRKYPILVEYQEFLKAHGALAALMSGSGSSTFALFPSDRPLSSVELEFKKEFGDSCWIAAVAMSQ